MAENIRNYINFGVSNIWFIDSKTRESWDCSDGDWVRRKRFEVPGKPMYLSLPELFNQIHDDNA